MRGWIFVVNASKRGWDAKTARSHGSRMMSFIDFEIANPTGKLFLFPNEDLGE